MTTGKRGSRWAPPDPIELRVAEIRRPRALGELSAIERADLEPLLGDQLPALLAREDNEVELAILVDAQGRASHRLYAWNFGTSYLFSATDGRLLAFGAQHIVETWHRDQRPLFWAIDRALTLADPPLEQPLSFEWWNDAAWRAVADGEDHGRDPRLAALRARGT